MAWVTQQFKHGSLEVTLEADGVQFNEFLLWLRPKKQEDAHNWAMMLRRAARRLEEVGKGLPQ